MVFNTTTCELAVRSCGEFLAKQILKIELPTEIILQKRDMSAWQKPDQCICGNPHPQDPSLHLTSIQRGNEASADIPRKDLSVEAEKELCIIRSQSLQVSESLTRKQDLITNYLNSTSSKNGVDRSLEALLVFCPGGM